MCLSSPVLFSCVCDSGRRLRTSPPSSSTAAVPSSRFGSPPSLSAPSTPCRWYVPADHNCLLFFFFAQLIPKLWTVVDGEFMMFCGLLCAAPQAPGAGWARLHRVVRLPLPPLQGITMLAHGTSCVCLNWIGQFCVRLFVYMDALVFLTSCRKVGKSWPPTSRAWRRRSPEQNKLNFSGTFSMALLSVHVMEEHLLA